jgi:hypothetical protein
VDPSREVRRGTLHAGQRLGRYSYIAIWTLQELIEADVLIMAQGCFSYCAGFISDGIKIFDLREMSVNDLPGWRWPSVSPMDSWIPCKADGTFDPEAFERQLLIIIRAKAIAARIV